MRNMRTIFNGVKFSLWHGGAQVNAVLEWNGYVIPPPEQENGLVHFTNLLIGLDG